MRIDSIPWIPHLKDRNGDDVFIGDTVKVLRGVFKGRTGTLSRTRLKQKTNYIDVKGMVNIHKHNPRYSYQVIGYTTTGWLWGDGLELIHRK